MDRKHIPIFSTLEEDPELRDSIDEFVVKLAERIDALQDAEAHEDYAELRGLCDAIAAESEGLGYEPLAKQARIAVRACDEDKPDTVREALIEATDIARRIRLGHRGAI